MHRHIIALLFFCLASFGASREARAESRLALVIGIDRYSQLGTAQQLQRAVNDARSVRQALQGLGFDVTTGENVDRSTFNRLWQSFLDKISPGDTVAFYFSGHGVEIEGLNFLLPSDLPNIGYGRQEQLKRESLSVAEFLLDLKRRRPQVSLIVLDACRDNPFAPSETRSAAARGGLAGVINPPEGTFIMYSAGAGEIALDRLPQNDPDQTNSLYTRHLLPLLRTPGLALPDLARQLRQQVNTVAAAVPHVQRPAYYDGLMGHYCPAGCEVKKAPAQARTSFATALASARGSAQRPNVAALLNDPDSRSSVDQIGEVMNLARANYVELPSDLALMTSAIDGMQRKFGNEATRAVADKGVGTLTKAAFSPDAVEYPLLDIFGEVFEIILNGRPAAVSSQAITRAAIDGTLSGLDTQSWYYDPVAYQRLRVADFGTFGGVGIELNKRKDQLKIILPLEGSPGARAGLLADDTITHINGEPIQDLTLDESVDRLRGAVGTSVSVTVSRESQAQPLNLTIVRDTVVIDPIRARLEAGGTVGYIKIRNFNRQAHIRLVRAFEQLRTSGGDSLEGYVIDLRDNIGGPLDQTIAVADDFLDAGAVIAIIKGRGRQEIKRYTAKAGDISGGRKLVVLVNEKTAAGAEILAGALKDNKRATIVGVQSRGVGSIQTIYPMGNPAGSKGAARLTTERFHTPNGQSIEIRGIAPDIRAPNPANLAEADTQLAQAIEVLKKK